jgi:hydroxymethylpyrimidine/phosphomethylpyrimidine kinase
MPVSREVETLDMSKNNEQLLKQLLDDAQASTTNLFEFYLLNDTKPISSSENVHVFDTGLSKEVFYNVMHEFQNRYQRHQVQQYKCNVLGDTYYLNSNNQEIIILSKRTTTVEQMGKKILCVGSNKKKLSILSFPSTHKFDNEEIVKSMTFKLSNRLSIVLLQSKTLDNQDENSSSYEIKISYSHDVNIDKDAIIKQVVKLIKDLEQASIC